MKRLKTKAAAAGKKAPSIMETASVSPTRPVPSQVFFRALVIAQGIMPAAKTVIVCAIHHPDSTIELEGGEHGKSQVFESYTVQYTMNTKLDHISFEIAHFLDNNGYDAVPIVMPAANRRRRKKEDWSARGACCGREGT